MRYNDGIIRWAKIATVLFIAMVVVADIFGIVITQYIAYCWAEVSDTPSIAVLAVVFYLGTVGAYFILFALFKLLSNMSKDLVFDRGIAAVCVVGGFVWNGCWILSIIALFMGLIVLSVKVVFDKAITMKEELDLTI